MTCEINPDGWCSTHKLWHRGAAAKLAVDPGPLGQRVRRAWDRLAAGLPPEGSPQPVSLPEVRENPRKGETRGPGTELKGLLAKLGFAVGNCKCNQRAEEMNGWGPAGCRERRAEIVAWLKQEADQRRWTARLGAAFHAARRLMTFLNPLDPLGSLVDEAIRLAEEKERAGR